MSLAPKQGARQAQYEWIERVQGAMPGTINQSGHVSSVASRLSARCASVGAVELASVLSSAVVQDGFHIQVQHEQGASHSSL